VQEPASGFLRAMAALAEAGVAYVVVGVGGINFYARTPAEAFSTLDLDALLEPTVGNLRSALRALNTLGYEFEAGGEPFLDLQDDSALEAVVRNGATLNAIHREVGQIDLVLGVAGFSYAELDSDAVEFHVADVGVRVGKLEKLLRSKQASGRPKDLAFLRAFEATAAEDENER
jgi:hypothetical protein